MESLYPFLGWACLGTPVTTFDNRNLDGQLNGLKLGFRRMPERGVPDWF